MSWNDKGGPWGPAPGSDPRGRNGASDPGSLDELLRRGRERLGEVLPPGSGGGRIAAAIVAVLALGWAASGIYRVDPNEEAVVQRFGAFVDIQPQGLHYHLPAPLETVTLVDVTRRNQTEIGYRRQADTMLTGDRNILEVEFVVVWQIRDPEKYLFHVDDPENLLRRASESAMREIIGQSGVQPALNEGRREIELASATILQRMLDVYDSGVQVAAVQLQKVDPPAPVVDAFNDVQRARSELEQQRNDAERYRNDILPRARGEAQQTILDAEGYKQQRVALVTGEAQRFQSIYAAYRESKEVTERRLYIEAMEAILTRSHNYVVDPALAAKGGVMPFLPLGQTGVAK